MKRYFIGLTLATLLALVYVQQRVWLIGIGYEVERLISTRDDLLDQHRVLDYNVLALRSPVILEERLSRRNVQLAPPASVEVFSPLHGSIPPQAPAWDAWAKSEPSWLERVLTFASRWVGEGPRAIAEPANDQHD